MILHILSLFKWSKIVTDIRLFRFEGLYSDVFYLRILAVSWTDLTDVVRIYAPEFIRKRSTGDVYLGLRVDFLSIKPYQICVVSTITVIWRIVKWKWVIDVGNLRIVRY